VLAAHGLDVIKTWKTTIVVTVVGVICLVMTPIIGRRRWRAPILVFNVAEADRVAETRQLVEDDLIGFKIQRVPGDAHIWLGDEDVLHIRHERWMETPGRDEEFPIIIRRWKLRRGELDASTGSSQDSLSRRRVPRM
jgi:hypothetical protein